MSFFDGWFRGQELSDKVVRQGPSPEQIALAKDVRTGKYQRGEKPMQTDTPEQVVDAQFSGLNEKQKSYLINVVTLARENRRIDQLIQSAETYGLKISDVQTLAISQRE